MKRKVTIIAILLIITGLIGMAVTGKDYFSFERTEGEKTFSSQEVREIFVESNVSDVTFLPSADQDVQVKWEGKIRSEVSSEIDINLEDGRLTVDLKGDSFFKFFQFPWNNYSIKVYVPEDILEKLVIDSSVGDIRIEDLGAKELHVKTDVSDVELKGVRAEKLQVSSSVGDIRIEDSHGKLEADNDVGNIRIRARAITGDMNVKTNVGDIILETSDSEEASIFGSSDIGSISIFNGKETKYLIEDAKYIIDLKTNVGDIKVSDL